MNFPVPTENVEIWIGFGLFVLSEAIGMSKAKPNSVLQLVLHMASELFPYEVQRRQPATRANRPRRRRDERGRFIDEP
jgi:hypothetical protein